jgi:peroxiredoxin Q/BCP
MQQGEQSSIAESAAWTKIALFDQRAKETRLEDFRGRVVVLYFYPMDDTPGCTVETREFRKLNDRFAALDCTIIGVSVDSVELHRAFAAKHRLPFTLLSDSRGELANALGVLRGGIASRSTFILGRDLQVLRVFHEVKPRGHAG